jgi:hypothetical protein
MAVKHGTVSLTTGASAMLNLVETDGNVGQSIIVSIDSGTAYLGASNVAGTAYGYALTSGVALSLDLPPNEILYGISASGTVTARVLSVGA